MWGDIVYNIYHNNFCIFTLKYITISCKTLKLGFWVYKRNIDFWSIKGQQTMFWFPSQVKIKQMDLGELGHMVMFEKFKHNQINISQTKQ